MNWRQGIWRACALMAALWLVLVFSEEEFLGPVNDYWNNYSLADGTVAKPPRLPVEFPASAADICFLNELNLNELNVEECAAARQLQSEARKAELEAIALRREAEIERYEAEMVRYEASVLFSAAKIQLINFLQAALLPPLVLLAFGFAVAWVLRGFRKAGPES